MESFLQSKWFLIIFFTAITAVIVKDLNFGGKRISPTAEPAPSYWVAPCFAIEAVEEGEDRLELIYGRNLIANTAEYLGPAGSISPISNGMNCQNCHLNAGRKPFGNNFGAVASTYPKLRARSGTVENIEKRVNDCFERSLNGKALSSTSKEMKAIVAYLKWLGKNVPKNEKPLGSGISTLTFLDRPASPSKGEIVYFKHCQNCHGKNGEGLKKLNSKSFTYPPLWGEGSYNEGAGLFRLSRFAGFVKDNMPFDPGTNHFQPKLSDEEAWDVAAFVNTQPRPKMDLSRDWPDISGKPFDYPFGPYSDNFSETQHKFGPFDPIIKAKQQELPKVSAK